MAPHRRMIARILILSITLGTIIAQSCDFEKDTCGWTQAKNDKFDWTRQSGKTGSGGTGASSDHTSLVKKLNVTTTNGQTCVFPFTYLKKRYNKCIASGLNTWCATTSNYDKDNKWGYCNPVGFYMFIEASSPRRKGDNAVLLSKQQTGTKCLSFWYHMFGPHVDRLVISTVSSGKRGAALWQMKGTKGNQWLNSNVTINANKSMTSYQIVIEAIRGVDYKGDISIDDIVMTDGDCNANAGGGGSSKGLCTFEKDMCGFTQDKSDNFDWRRHRGQTSSSNTGPKADHTTGTTSGYYVYVETSNTGVNQRGRIMKDYTGLKKGGSCLTFWYHMFGIHQGTLKVYTNATSTSPIFSVTGQQGNLWVKGEATITSTSAKVIFEGITSWGYAGDMALDDIQVLDGPCPIPGQCSFQNGWCTWYNIPNSQGDNFDWIIGSGGTSSSYTGPSADRFGSKTGKYVFLESSSPRRTGDKTRLVSEVFNQTSSNGQCFIFYYHMLGTSIGSLNIYVNASGTENLVWTLSGNKGNKWLNGQVNVGRVQGSYKIIIEGVRGTSYTGDIAIDDFTFKKGSCSIVPSNALPGQTTTTTTTTTMAPTTLPPATGFNCNFETGICSNWYQDTTDQLNWSLGQGQTSSFGTGPKTDHTLKNAYGKYAFLEVSGNKKDAAARLVSQKMAATNANAGKCLSFWYHMYGPHIGTLNIYVAVGSKLTGLKPFWSRSGTQGNKWIQGLVTLHAGQPFNTVFEATVGTSYQGDIAIDDISVSDGKCVQPSTTCTFENDACGYTNDKANFNWARNSKNTNSFGTGPKTDHTLQSASGFYLYTEASGRKFRDTARILSPIEKPTTASCLQFWYHMYGTGMGTLSVLKKDSRGLSRTPLWRESGNQGDQWRVASVTISSRSDFQIAFEGVIGRNYQSDIAIDDVKYTSGACPSPGYCDFENGLCTYINSKKDDFDWIVGSAGTASYFTGPKFDHTTGSKNGSYVFLESSNPRKANETAVLISQQFNAVAGQKRCLNFWYHMYGSDIGTLEVVYRVYSGSQPEKVLWRLSGQQHNTENDPWKNARVPIDMNSDHSIEFRGKIGGGYRGDIAIDDIQITSLACTLTPSTADPNPKPTNQPTTKLPVTRPTTVAPGVLGCNFETDFCGLTQSKTDSFNWTRSQGFTNTKGSGPSTDHTYGKGAVGPAGPGSLKHSSGLCVHVHQGAWVKPKDSTKLVIYTGCGQDRLEFQLTNGNLKLTMYGMCAGPRGGATAPGTEVVIKDSCTDKWTMLNNGALQHSSGLCMGPKYGRTNDGQLFVLYNDCTNPNKLFTFSPTMGHYAYIEASSPRKPNDTARLVSPATSNPKCLNFWYHMYGNHINRLNVYIRNPNTQILGTPIWSKYGSHGDTWKPAHVYLNYRGSYVYVIEAVRGNGFAGDIAIDDITVTDQCPAPLECSFEETNPALCGWVNLKQGDKFDWSIGQGATSSGKTGPSSDHTYNDDKGKYLYIETSGNLRKGDNALVQSPSYPGNGQTNGQCFQFWYHMTGSSIGTMNLFVLKAGGQKGNAAWSKTGEQGNRWQIGQLTIYSQPSYQLLFEGIRGSSYTGDIAIDDLKMLDGPCNKLATCDFENAEKCTWRNMPMGDDFDWIVGSGITPSGWTGPKTDHTLLNGNGKYMYIEASKPRKVGEKARLNSESLNKMLNRRVPYCLRFWYHMLGSGIGTLNLYIKTGAGSTNEKLVWSLSGNQQNQWREGTAPIYSMQDFYLVFEAVIGSNVRGDIALDDIVYSIGRCPIQPVEADPNYVTTLPPTTPTTTVSPKDLLGCTFEGNTICRWTQSVNDKFNWTLHKGSTSTTDSGPSTDHTTGNKTGTYLYIEASYPRNDGDNARLVSPMMPSDKTSGKSHCFTFWFHMYGPHVNALNVWKLTGGNYVKLWTRVGDNGDVWRYAQVDLSSNYQYQVVIEGLRGTSYQGDISIDDIDIKDGLCPQPTFCDFEHDMCKYTKDPKGDFDWTRNRGATTSFGTGPSVDHTLQTKQGYYIYTEASGRRRFGDKARLIGPALTDNQAFCFQFWFHMRGYHIGNLNIYVKTAGGGQSLVWQRKGNHGDLWKIARVNIRPRQGRQIIIEGVRGRSFLGDIALDDLKLMPGYCPPPGDCSFDGGLCSWRNVKTNDDDFDWILNSGSTASIFTGPTKDHTTGSGKYVYIEASNQNQNEKAQLISEDFYPTYGRCIQFWAHMKGAGIGELSVYVRGQNATANSMTKIWTMSGQQGSGDWFSCQAPVASASDYQIVIEGTRGNSYTGDIAVDDIVFTNFRCVNHPQGSVATTPKPTTTTTTLAPTLPPNHYTCNFTYDKCNWKDDTTAHFNWTRAQGKTTSVGTGPQVDHTSGANGWYVFIETSYPRKINDTARLISDMIPSTNQMCLQFWYHMYGDHIANLTVYRKASNQMTILWQKAGTQGPRWRHATVDVSSASKFQLVLEGVKGSGYKGDIALDDITLDPGACPPQAECTFEDPNLCGWTNMVGDNFDWTRDNAGTSSSYTGPRNDHTYGTAAGYYMYIEASNPRSKGHKAWLKSKEYTPSLGRCLSFWYHMYGVHIGDLNVLIYTNGSRSAPIWTLSGNQGGYWRPARVTIRSAVPHSVIFEGRTGVSYRGDIAIDDVMISDGPCPDPGNCDFERDLCGYTNRQNIDNFDWMLGSGKTSSVYTGPKTDHTLGNANGRYLFVESSYPRLSNEKAIVLSETIPVKGDGKCVQFWYHMYGTDIGVLRVLMRVGFAISETVVWELNGNQGDRWYQGQAPMLSRGQNIQIRFMGIRGSGYKGDIAIDDITVVPYGAGCGVRPSSALPRSTNFERGLDRWRQSTTDQFQWTRSKGHTTSTGTGPSIDHTTNTTKGYYMYIEASYPRKENDTAALVSSTFIGNGTKVNYCLWFAYHMYGPHVDTLRVYTSSQGQNKPSIWQRKGSQGPNWRHGEAQITVLQNTQVVIEAKRGVSYKGDIAIDDLDFYYGDCVSSGVCTFEGANICGWWVNPRLPLKWTRASGSTLSTATGPKNDHTYGTPRGHYMYIETSTGAVNSKAEMWSSWYYSSGQHCAQFFYHMYGDNIGTLTVLVSYSGSSLRYIKFRKSGNQNDTWNMGRVTINRKGWFRMLVRATKGNGYKGDIAVDDFRIRDGACPAEGDCDFEHADLCDWQQETKNDKFDWIIGSGKTGSWFTGPKIDHTTQSSGGYYAFVETSAPRQPGDKAIIKSIKFDATSATGKCMTFWYHMYGNTIGDLRVYLRTFNGVNTLKTDLMWKLSGNQGNQWMQGRMGIRMNVEYQIVIEAVRGSSFTGDIAVDDIEFTNSYCNFMPMTAWPPGKSTPIPPTTTTTLGPTTGNTGNDCNFDVNICPVWKTNSSRGNFLWKRHQGSTASAGTGPKQDHTKGTDKGYYVYIETSSPARINDTAWLYNDKVDDSMDHCMSFWYHMYGPHVGSLKVYLSYAGNSSLVWQRSGTQGDRWRHGQIFVKRSTRNQPLTVIFEGVRGASFAGDIALDDVAFAKNSCPIPRECTFESDSWNDASGSNNMCGWTQSNADDFDWTIGSANTPSVKTGPRADHTLNTSAGHYLYIEASWPRRYGQKADIISKQVQPTKGQCFTFWYHMYGRTVGNLTLFQRANGADTPIWQRSSNQGNAWRPAMATIKGNAQFQLMFRGTVGRSYDGDIAIDDIIILDGECPRPGDCDFENFGMCTYMQGKVDEFDWIRAHGGTSSWRTGPSKDNTKGDATGHYMFIETSAPRKTGDRAVLISEQFQPTSRTNGRCLQFYRHMYGPHIGTLNVYRRIGDNQDTKIWTDSGNQGNSWIQSQVPVFSDQPFRLVFEAVRGTSYQGDIALDDINFSNNFYPCSYIPSDSKPPTVIPTTITPADANCTFDQGLCKWTQRTDDKFDWTLKKGKTGSTGTGPLGDHTSGNGQYAYIEASYPRKENDTAVLRSPKIRPITGGVCFRFNYHMHGPHVGTLNVYRVIGKSRVKIFTRVGTQGNAWRTGQVNIRGVRQIFYIEVEGVRGVSYAGDISIDDFIVSDGWCRKPAHCDFERDQCFFSNTRSGDKFDWKRSNAGTPSLGTGPRTDHTTGTSLGTYFFIETSYPRRKGDNAILYSNVYFSAKKGARCFNFWYHMQGSGIGTMNIFQYSRRTKPIWTKSGDQGNKWIHGRVTIGEGMKYNYRLYIEGIRGVNYQGDIAIDDVWVDEYPCPAAGACDFESQSFCTWSQVPNLNSNRTGYDDFDWELQSGSTPSIGTGPKVDHTKGTPLGTYAYIEVSTIKPGKKAQLISEKMTATKGRCLSFWYHMLGTGIGNLNFYIQDQNGRQLVKTISGNQGSTWNAGEVGLHSKNDFNVIIEAEHGTSYRGDISLDDINVKEGNCVGLCSSVPATARVSCGPSTVTASTCVINYGCCYDDTMKDQGLPSCFQHPGTCAAVPVVARTQCGYVGISSYYCGKRGCCYDASANGPKCYNPLSKPTDFPTTMAPPTTPKPSIYDCNFEKNFCSFTNMAGDNLNWQRHKGETGSWGTGPKVDHTQGNEQGYYAYVETSFSKQNATANLRSPRIAFTSGGDSVCVRFWYHMFGQHVGAFNIYQTQSSTKLGKMIWQRKGALVDDWVYGHVTVPRSPAFYMVFQAVRGPGYQGDVAIDDVSFVNGPCPPTMTCGFENSGMCGWTQDASDQFDWSKGTGNTTSVQTGPKWDKTYETGFGHYLYIEGSYPRQPGDIARIESFEHAPTKGKCFQFYYNMYGNGIGTMNIYIRRGKTVDPKPLWSLTGEQGREWLRGLVTVEEDSTNWKLIIEGIRGGNFNSDIAIDELMFTDGACTPKGDCDFEDKNACGYENDKTNKVDWLVYSGSTPSYNTGPTVDHTTGTTTGMYLYMEASSPARRGDTGNFVSEKFKVNPNFKWCVDFWYHMFGDGAGALRMQTRYRSAWSNSRLITSTKWTMEGNQGNEWRHAQVNITSSYDFQLVFQGEVGTGKSHQSDIALDDIVVTEGVCAMPKPPPTPNPCLRKCKDGRCISSEKVCDFYPDCAQGSDPTDDSDEHGCDGCDFESNTCYYKDSSKGSFKWFRKNGRTSSYLTGPSTDHTKGTSSGYYVYVEASVGKNYDLATFNSPTIKQASSTCRMTFWYHMYGTSIGELAIYVVQGYRLTNVWNLRGDQGNQWKQGVAYINRRAGPYSIQFTASRSNSFQGDIALDDISFQGCSLPSPSKYCNTRYFFRCQQTRACISPHLVCDFTDDCGDGSDELNCNYRRYPFRCNFEYGLCTWRNLKDDQFDFIRHKGFTDSSGTGPKYDHTRGTSSGYYLYAEASWPRRKGDKARLVSTTMNPTNYQQCYLRIYYHMLGQHVGVLRVKTRKCQRCEEKIVWQNSLATIDNWVRRTLIVRSDVAFQVIIEAEIGDGFAGDISLDDISFEGCTQARGTLPTALPTTPGTTTTTPCAQGEMYCSKDGKCISAALRCDHRGDCSDGEDEWGCGSCTFERDTCNYNDVSTGKIEFQRLRPADMTAAPDVPKADATLLSKAGYFMIAQQGTGNNYGKATMLSAKLSATAPQCKLLFSYYYNGSMSAARAGFYQDVKGKSTYNQLFWKNFGKKSTWQEAVIGIGSKPQGWQLQFIGDNENVAIDNIELVDCAFPIRTAACNYAQIGCTSGGCFSPDQECDFSQDCGDGTDEKEAICANYKERCDFETDKCNWYDDNDDDFNFQRTRSVSHPTGLGPQFDHTSGLTSGYFLTIFTNANRPNDTARLLSAVFLPSTGCTMRFWYHMLGSKDSPPATLNIKMKTSAAAISPMKTLWTQTGDQGDMWTKAVVHIPSTKNYQMVIEVKRTYNRHNKVAIDDISFSKECKPSLTATLDPRPITPSPAPGCKSGEWSCGDGQCIPYDKYCNFVADCANKADEERCPSSCDFEDGKGCKWYNSWWYDQMDWVVHQGKTPSNNTGPPYDHTKGTADGHYLYMEAGQRKQGQYPNAHFVSPMYYKGAYECTFNFWYNMYHFDRKTSDVKLNVMYRRDGRDSLLWSRSTTTGDKWKKATVKLPPCPTDFRMVFEGFHYFYSKTDAAIDDWSFDCAEKKPTACASDQFTCSKTQQCVSKNDLCDNEPNCCDGSDEDVQTLCKGYTKFDWQYGLGGWTQLQKNDTFDFTTYSGRTASYFTGPKADHTYQEEHGRYLYAESSGKSKNDSAALASATIGPTSTLRYASKPCMMSFWYHMRGSHIGSLNVYQANNYGSMDNLVWAKTGDQGTAWVKGAVSLTSDKDFQIIIQAKMGVSFRGDIAIDDVIFSPECVFNGNQLPGAPKPPPVDPCLPKFQCRLSGQCISRSQVCDFVKDCPGGTDEEQAVCGYPQGFEKSIEPWKHSKDDSYEWQLWKGNTQSGGTGPRTDARGDAKGGYAYLETSNRQKDQGGTLMTPTIAASYSDCTVEFYYHMFGSHVGLLYVQLQPAGDSQADYGRLFELKGEQGKDWIKTSMYVGRRKTPFYLNFTALAGGGARGDIAIDEINFKNCGPPPVCGTTGNDTGDYVCGNARCVSEDKICDLTDDCGDSTDESVNGICLDYIGCTFETHDYDPCNMTQDTSSDDFDWTYNYHYSPSYNTGPTTDHTLGTWRGHYYYIESSGKKAGSKARMLSLPIEAKKGGKCNLRFYYHMFGKHVKDLNVYTLTAGNLDSVFSVSGNFGYEWKFAKVDLSTKNEKFQLVFEGIVGQSFLSDIAIDDIILSPDCLTNSTRVYPTPIACGDKEFTCRTLHQCINSTKKCDGTRDCKDGSDEESCGGTSGRSTGGLNGHQTSVMAASVVGGIVVLLVIVIVLYIIVKRRKEKKLHLFSVFYDPTKQGEQEAKEKPSSSGKEKLSVKKSTEGVSNPVYDEDNMAEFSMGDVDTDMFPDDNFQVTMDTKGGATSMANPLYQDPYMEDDDSPLSNF